MNHFIISGRDNHKKKYTQKDKDAFDKVMKKLDDHFTYEPTINEFMEVFGLYDKRKANEEKNEN